VAEHHRQVDPGARQAMQKDNKRLLEFTGCLERGEMPPIELCKWFRESVAANDQHGISLDVLLYEPPKTFVFIRGESGWFVGDEVTKVHIVTTKGGFGMIHYLLSMAGKECPAMEVEQLGAISEQPMFIHGDQSLVDRRALSEVQARREEVAAGIDAETSPEQAAALRDELVFLDNYLRGVIGLRGSRRFPGFVDKSRQRVTKAIKRAVDEVSSHHPALAEHLGRFISTGFVCSYAPDEKTNWNL